MRHECARLDAAGVKFAPFREPDRGGELTAIATELVYGPRRALFRHLSLLKEDAVPGPARAPRAAEESARSERVKPI